VIGFRLVRVSAKVDYAVRALAELAAREPDVPVKGETLARSQAIPLRFLENILAELRAAGIVASRRGAEGGYWLARPASDVTIGEVIRVLEGPLANVQGVRPDEVEFEGAARALRDVWVATRAGLRSVLDEVTFDAVVSGRLPRRVSRMLEQPGAWDAR
jgi:Rrf2 family protein